MVGCSLWPLWVHAAVVAVQVQLQAARALEVAPHRHLHSQHGSLCGGLLNWGMPMHALSVIPPCLLTGMHRSVLSLVSEVLQVSGVSGVFAGNQQQGWPLRLLGGHCALCYQDWLLWGAVHCIHICCRGVPNSCLTTLFHILIYLSTADCALWYL